MNGFETFSHRTLVLLALACVLAFVLLLSKVALNYGEPRKTQPMLSESCVDEKIVIRGPGWRAWKIDSTNKPEKC